jgi:hypothetical protein
VCVQTVSNAVDTASNQQLEDIYLRAFQVVLGAVQTLFRLRCSVPSQRQVDKPVLSIHKCGLQDSMGP